VGRRCDQLHAITGLLGPFIGTLLAELKLDAERTAGYGDGDLGLGRRGKSRQERHDYRDKADASRHCIRSAVEAARPMAGTPDAGKRSSYRWVIEVNQAAPAMHLPPGTTRCDTRSE